MKAHVDLFVKEIVPSFDGIELQVDLLPRRKWNGLVLGKIVAHLFSKPSRKVPLETERRKQVPQIGERISVSVLLGHGNTSTRILNDLTLTGPDKRT